MGWWRSAEWVERRAGALRCCPLCSRRLRPLSPRPPSPTRTHNKHRHDNATLTLARPASTRNSAHHASSVATETTPPPSSSPAPAGTGGGGRALSGASRRPTMAVFIWTGGAQPGQSEVHSESEVFRLCSAKTVQRHGRRRPRPADAGRAGGQPGRVRRSAGAGESVGREKARAAGTHAVASNPLTPLPHLSRSPSCSHPTRPTQSMSTCGRG